jgi:CHAT domain-containing protein/Tfp pilus assembly protein PilF
VIPGRFFGVWTAVSLLALSGGAATAAERADAPTALEPGQPVAAELGGGKSHYYSVTAAPDQFFRISVAQLGVQVALTLTSPDGKKLLESAHSPPATEPEDLAWIAEAGGMYRVEVRSAAASSTPGPYTIVLDELHPASPDDRERLRAWRLEAEADRLSDNGTAESRKQAIAKYEEALAVWKRLGDRREQSSCLLAIGQAYQQSSGFPKAMGAYDEALLLARDGRDRRAEADVLTYIATVQDSLGERAKAIENLNRVIPMWREVGYEGGEMEALGDLAAVYASRAESDKAIESYSRALPMAIRMGDDTSQAVALTGLALAYDFMGEPQHALDNYDQALALARRINNRRGIASILGNLSLTYNRIGEHERALEVLTESLRMRREVGDRRGEAYTLTSLGRTYDLLGRPDEALAYYHQALRIRREVGDRRGEANTLKLIGVSCSSLGENEAALRDFEQSLEVRQATGDTKGDFGDLLNRLGATYAALGQSDRALDTLAAGLEAGRAVDDRLQQARSLVEIAKVDASRNDFGDARNRLEDAFVIIESFRAHLLSPDLRATFLSTVEGAFTLALDVWMGSYRQTHDEAFAQVAFGFAERARARSTLDLLTEAHADIREGVDPALLDRERTTRRALAAGIERRMRLLAAPHTAEQTSAADRDVRDKESELDQVEAQIRSTAPGYAALTQPQPESLADIQRTLDTDSLLLEYALGKDRAFLWAITPSSIDSYDLGKRSEVEAAARRLFELLTEPTRMTGSETAAEKQARARRASAELPRASAEMSALLLGPLENRLQNKRVVVVADGALQYLPFAALSEPSSARMPVAPTALVASHEVVNLPSASVLAVLRRDVASRRSPAKTVAVLADPVFERDDERVTHASHPQASGTWQPEEPGNKAAYRSAPEVGLGQGQAARIPRLLYSRREAESILGLVPSGSRLRALDFEASRATAMSPELGQYRFVHFATHGFLNSAEPRLSGIVFSLVDSKGREVPGYLSAADTFNMKLPVDLVVLSGCQTALGRQIRGEGLVGLTRGFMYAGARAVVASLWKVDDAATAEFMHRFYSAMLRDGLAPVSALQRVQLEMSRSTLWSDPLHWAAFVLQGDWRAGVR